MFPPVNTPLTQSGAATDPATDYLRQIWHALGGQPAHLAHLTFTGSGALPSVFAVTDLAAASVGAASLAVAELIAASSGVFPQVQADRRLASFWFGSSIRPQGWSVPPIWDVVAGDYRTKDGWIRLHTNAVHHREAALAVLGTAADKAAVTAAVARWEAGALESAIVEQRGCAAAMRTLEAWADHPQGRAVAAEPLIHRASAAAQAIPGWQVPGERPLHGIRVLDLTRILAGPTATRFLAGFGAEVLRIDPLVWEEPATVPDVVLGKRCARLDLKNAADRAIFEHLLGQADVLVHGYRSDALAHLGLDPERRRQINPALVDVSLDAYGWSGPWQARRGFDSLVQMSSGIADAGMRRMGRDIPTPLPVQALDCATGYLMAAAAVRGLTQRLATGAGSEARFSLARTAQLLVSRGYAPSDAAAPAPERRNDQGDTIELTAWGPARRVLPPASVEGALMHWDYPAAALGSSPAAWA